MLTIKYCPETLEETNINNQLEIMESLAVETNRNGADEVVSKIITDCPKRAEFEGLLERLEALKHKDLITAQQLFDSCGGYYAERKAVMVSRLEREYEILVIPILDKSSTIRNPCIMDRVQRLNHFSNILLAQ